MIPTACAEPPSTVTVYPLASRFEPVVLVVTVRLPVVAAQLTANDAVTVPPEGTVTVREVPPLTVQLGATPAIATVWLAAAKLG